MVKIIDKTDPRKRENKVFQSMLERAERMFGAEVTSNESLSIFDIYKHPYSESPLLAAQINIPLSLIRLHNPEYLGYVERLAHDYESMPERKFISSKIEFTIELDYK